MTDMTTQHPMPHLTDKQKVEAAIEVAMEYGFYDGDHHKQWTICQMLRVLMGEDGYNRLKATFEKESGGIPFDEGSAP